MKIEKIDPNNEEQAKTFVSWYLNPVMVRNWVVHREESEIKAHYTIDQFKEDFSKLDKVAFMIKVEGSYIGYGSFFINHPVCMHKEGKVCWPSIGVGHDEFRNKGFGMKICQEILKLAKEHECTHIEAGIFEFNERMKSILLQNNFKLIGKREKMTFYNGQWWDSGQYLLEI